MGKGKKCMVHESVPCYHTGEEIRVGRWKLDSTKPIPGIVYITEDETDSHYHFYWNNQIKRFEAHIKYHDKRGRKPYEMTFQKFRGYQITKAMKEGGTYQGQPPYGFVRQVQGKRYPKKIKI